MVVDMPWYNGMEPQIIRTKHENKIKECETNFKTYQTKPKVELKAEEKETKEDKYEYKLEIVWINVIAFAILHVWSLYGLYQWLTVTTWRHFLYVIIYANLTSLGVTAGAHRLYTHRAYKAKLPLQLLLIFFQTAAGQNSMYIWVRDHRVHHKYSETDADPHNANRGFFFAHMGWLMCKKHRDVKEKGKTIDMSDLDNDPIVQFQYKYYWYMYGFASFLLPAFIPWYFWGEPFMLCFNVNSIFRYLLSLHLTWCINSVAHMYGHKPYDKNIGPTDSTNIHWFTNGESWHNYHHVYPWDYKAAELGYKQNLSTLMIDFFAWIGWAYDRKTVSQEVIEKRSERTGDGSRTPYTPKPDESYRYHDGSIWKDSVILMWTVIIVSFICTFF